MYPEVLNLQGHKILQKLKNFSEFYLAGGTALALQIGHRRSIDFDLFSKKDISPDLLIRVNKIFQDSKINVIVNYSGQLSVSIDQVKVDFTYLVNGIYQFFVFIQTLNRFSALNFIQEDHLCFISAAMREVVIGPMRDRVLGTLTFAAFFATDITSFLNCTPKNMFVL